MKNLALAACAAALLSACAGGRMMPYSKASLPDAVKVPAGHKVAMETVGSGSITYECRVKQNAPGQHEWFFVGPDASLTDRGGKPVGKYFGPPATWESVDGSKVSGAQVAVAPAAPGSIPYQLVKANPAIGSGSMNGVSYIQRVETRGGVAPAMPCGSGNLGQKQVVQYHADYIFYTASM